MEPLNDSKILIAQININSIGNKKNEIDHLIREKNVTILCLNDTRLVKSKRIRLAGYKLLRKDNRIRGSRAGGVAIAIKNGIKAFEVDSMDLEEFLIVDVKIGHLIIRIATIYAHPGEKVSQRHFDAICTNNNAGVNSKIDATIFIGDVNAHVGLGPSGKIDNAGVHLQRLVDANGFFIRNDDSPTFFSFGRGISSCIDLCMVKCSGSSIKTAWSIVGDCGSDHRMTGLSIDGGFHIEEKAIKCINWTKVKEKLEQTTLQLDCGSENGIDESIRSFNQKLNAAVDENTTTKQVLTRDGHFLSDATTKDIKLRRKLIEVRKSWEANGKPTTMLRNLINNLNKEIKRKIKKDVEVHESLQINDIEAENDSGKAWEKLRLFDPELGKSRSADDFGAGIEDANGVLQREEEAVAAIFSNRLADCHSFPTAPSFNNSFKNKINTETAQIVQNLTPIFRNADDIIRADTNHFVDETHVGSGGRRRPPEIHAGKITTNEIKEVLKKKKNRSSVGRDGISYRMLKSAGENVSLFLARLYTILLVTGYFPRVWREATVKMIPKGGGKDPKNPKNWRPISLSSCASKLFESCVKERVVRHLDANGDENPFQAAYKKGRSTQEHLLRLSEEVTDAFKNQECVVAVFLDVQGAFDKVWTTGLIWKVSKRLPLHLVRLIYGFLRDRHLRVMVGHFVDQPIWMDAGTPQGAVLSPILFNIFVDDVKDILGNDVSFAQYADDLAIWVRKKDPKDAERILNKKLDDLSKWTSDWRIKLAPEKSISVVFSRRPTIRRIPIKLKLLGEEIERRAEHKFLGVTYDDKLLFNKHVDKIIGGTMTRIHALKKLAAKSTFSKPTMVLRLHEALVNSIFKYGAVAYAGMSNAIWERIRKCHARCVKAYVGMPNFVSYGLICDSLGVKQIREEICDFARERIISMILFSPLGKKLIKRSDAVSIIYKTPSETLMNGATLDLL